MQTAIYVGKNKPDLTYGQTGQYFYRMRAFVPDGDLANATSVAASEMYFSGESKQQCKRGYPINPAWKTAEFGILQFENPKSGGKKNS